MNTLLISYDLGSPETSTDYQDLIAAIKAYGPWAKPLYSQWLVKTSKDQKTVRTELRAHLDSNDKILVIDVTNDAAAWHNLPSNVSQWIKDNL